MTIEALRVRRLEARLVNRARLVTPCSANDIADTVAFAPLMCGKAVVIPNGVDCATYADVAPLDGKSGLLLITGSYDWLPNRRGLMWFLDDVLPIFEQHYAEKNINIRVAGRMSADFAAKLNALSPRLTAVPNVPRMTDELRNAAVVAVPVIASSGTRLRILEAWAAGRPIVTTPHGAFGLDHVDGSDLFSCPDARTFADAAVTLLEDAELRARLRAAGLERAKRYDWSAIGDTLIESFEQFGLLPRSVRADEAVQAES
jgi:glycosyltransferase involved in cell wall biosynthesis